MANIIDTLTGALVPTTNIWDVQQLYELDVESPEFKELLVRLYQNINQISLLLNVKDTGYYSNSIFMCGQNWFPNPALTSASSTQPDFRPVFRVVVNFGTLPNAGAKTVAHGLTVNTSTSFTRIYATATDPVGFNYIPIPYASPTAANNIEISIDANNVTITTGSNRTNFTTCYVVLEYITT